MGNYYEGELSFVLRKDLPKNLLKLLNELENKPRTEIIVPEEYKKVPLFNTKDWFYNRYSFNCFYDKYSFNKDLESFTNFNIAGYLLEITICTTEYDNLGEKLYDFFKDYLDTDLSPIYIGRIDDEDCYYSRTFLRSGYDFSCIKESEYKIRLYNDIGGLKEEQRFVEEIYKYNNEKIKEEHICFMSSMKYKKIYEKDLVCAFRREF